MNQESRNAEGEGRDLRSISDEFRGLKPVHGKIESGSQKARKESLNQESRNAGRDGRGSPLNLLGSKRPQGHAEYRRWPSDRPFSCFLAFLIQYLCSPSWIHGFQIDFIRKQKMPDSIHRPAFSKSVSNQTKTELCATVSCLSEPQRVSALEGLTACRKFRRTHALAVDLFKPIQPKLALGLSD